MKHIPRKRFGQNFLQDKHVINQIIKAINPKPNDNILEIGPGLGALTGDLVATCENLTVIEIDKDLHQDILNISPRIKLIDSDALKVDYRSFGEHLRIVGNLPYNISTPLLIHLLGYVSSIKDMHFMLQKEVVERMTAPVGSSNYGRLSVILQYYCDVTHLFDVMPDAFFPKPKVDSAIVRIEPHKASPYGEVASDVLEEIVRMAFSMRRKTLFNNVKSIISREALSAMGIEPSLRPEQISVNEYVQLAKFVSK